MVNDTLPVTSAITRRPRAGKEAELASWAADLVERAGAFPGHLGAQIVGPESAARPEVTIVFSFASAQAHTDWENSEERARCLETAAELVEGPHRAHSLVELEGLFSRADRPAGAPPRWRTAVVIGLSLYPLSLGVNVGLGPLLAGLHPLLRSLTTTVAVVPLMVWVMVPLVSRLLHRWLRPHR